MLATVLRMPLRWVDTIPLGRILNRFTADFNVIDGAIPGDMAKTLDYGLKVIAILVATLLASPLVTLLGFGLMPIALWVARFYLPGARDIKRLDSVNKSPVFEQVCDLSIAKTFDNFC